jgi:hypothetical protein
MTLKLFYDSLPMLFGSRVGSSYAFRSLERLA